MQTINTHNYLSPFSHFLSQFFVASDPTVKDERLWHDKYSLRRAMVPSFLPLDQANKIMLTGKSINFLRQLCHDRTTIRNRDLVKMAETSQGRERANLG